MDSIIYTGQINLQGENGESKIITYNNFSGATGPTGERGATGPTGERGATGPTGERGAKGDPGPGVNTITIPALSILYNNSDSTGITGSSDLTTNNVKNTSGLWDSFFAYGANNTIFDIKLLGNDIYFGGSFTNISGLDANGIAKYNTVSKSWSSFGQGFSGLSNAIILPIDSNNVFFGGNFRYSGNTALNFIAKWNGTSWSSLGSGLNGTVSDMVYDSTNNLLYVGGSFTTAGGITVNRVARWNITTSTWSAIGIGANNTVRTLFLRDSNTLVAGGSFTTLLGTSCNYIGSINLSTTTASALGSGFNNICNDIIYDNSGNLYTCGSFTQASGVANTVFIAQWNGTSWSALGTGLGSSGGGNALAYDSTNNLLYVGGSFTTAGGITVNRIARWNITTSTWAGLPAKNAGTSLGVDNAVNTLCLVNSNNIYMGGSFINLTDTTVFNTVNRITRWNGSILANSNIQGISTSVAIQTYYVDSIGNIYVGGTFTLMGGVANTVGIAKWDITTSTWVSLGTGLTGGTFVNVIAPGNNNDIYVGGFFTNAGGIPANNIARWDITTSTWSALGTGVNNQVLALVYDNTNNFLYTGGSFTSAGGISTVGIARWNGTVWSALSGGGFNAGGGCSSLVLDTNGNLWVGGSFTTAGSFSFGSIAKYNVNTQNWYSPLGNSSGDGLNSGGTINNIILDSRQNLYVSGTFTSIGGINITNIAFINTNTNTASEAFKSLGNITPTPTSIVLDSNDFLYATVSGVLQVYNGYNWRTIASTGNTSCKMYYLNNVIYLSAYSGGIVGNIYYPGIATYDTPINFNVNTNGNINTSAINTSVVNTSAINFSPITLALSGSATTTYLPITINGISYKLLLYT